MKANLIRRYRTFLRVGSLLIVGSVAAQQAAGQEFQAGDPIGTINEAGQTMAMTDYARVFGSFRFAESCTF